jgi:cation transport ATPase
MPDGSVKDVPLGELAVDDKVLIKPGEKIPADGVIVKGFAGTSALQGYDVKVQRLQTIQ